MRGLETVTAEEVLEVAIERHHPQMVLASPSRRRSPS